MKILCISLLSLWGSLAFSEDVVKIEKVEIKDGLVIANVSYTIESSISSELMIGLNLFEDDSFAMSHNVVKLKKGKGAAEIKIPLGVWKKPGHEAIYVNISAANRGNSWTPSAVDSKEIHNLLDEKIPNKF